MTNEEKIKFLQSLSKALDDCIVTIKSDGKSLFDPSDIFCAHIDGKSEFVINRWGMGAWYYRLRVNSVEICKVEGYATGADALIDFLVNFKKYIREFEIE